MNLYNSGKYTEAIEAFEDLNGYKDSKDKIISSLAKISSSLPNGTLDAEYYHTVGLKADGTVAAAGYNKYVSNWSVIVAVSAGFYHTVGLKSDGTVVAVGNNLDGQCDVSGWSDIVAVSAGVYHTVGLKSDGTVVAVGNNDFGQCDVSGWSGLKTKKE